VALAIPVVTVAIGYHYNAPAMYHEMEDATPRKFRRAVVAATVLCTALFSLVGLIGYFTFGPEVAGPLAGGNIVNNYPRSDRLMAIARIALAAHIVCVFPVIAISVRDALHRLSLRAAGQHEMAEDADVMVKAHRSVVVLEAAVVCGAAVAIAIDVPHISLVVDVVGVLFGIFLVFIAPGLMGLAINGGMWRTSRLAQQRLEAVDAFVKPSARRELMSLAIASLGSMAMIIGLLSVLGLIKIPP
jgi:amino acid permease